MLLYCRSINNTRIQPTLRSACMGVTVASYFYPDSMHRLTSTPNLPVTVPCAVPRFRLLTYSDLTQTYRNLSATPFDHGLSSGGHFPTATQLAQWNSMYHYLYSSISNPRTSYRSVLLAVCVFYQPLICVANDVRLDNVFTGLQSYALHPHWQAGSKHAQND